MTLSPQALRRLDAMTVLLERAPFVVVELPIRLQSRANDHTTKHWAKRAATSKSQHLAIHATLARSRARLRAAVDSSKLVVRLVRVAPSALDDDNLGIAFKAIRDGIAKVLGVDDRDPRVTFIPDAERRGVREYAVRIEFYHRTLSCLCDPNAFQCGVGCKCVGCGCASQTPSSDVAELVDAVVRSGGKLRLTPNIRRPR